MAAPAKWPAVTSAYIVMAMSLSEPWCAFAGSEVNVARLIAAGCDVDLTTNDGWTALHEAAANGHLGVVQHLLSASTQVRLPPGRTGAANSPLNAHH